MSNILRVKFGTSQTVNADSLWQYDYGQILKMEGLDLPNAYEVHFAKYGDETSVTMIGNADGVAIPDILLQTPGEIRAWLYLHTGLTDGETVYQVNIQVQLRAAPTNEEPTPVQQDTITQTLAALAQAQMDADEIVQTAESWAVGERGGVPVLPQDETYHNNAKYYADEANTAASSAAESASAADTSASNAATSASAASTSAASAASAKTAAENAADDAEESAHTASTDAANASHYAESASGSAITAALAASDAETAKEEAVGAKNDAGTFASNAETAADEAASSASSAASSTADAAGSAASAGASASAAAASASTASAKASAAAASADAAEAYMLHYPIVQSDYWYVWDAENEEYVSTNIKAKGEDGYDPTVAITTPASGVHRVTITDKSGDHVFDVLDGATGSQGAPGKGIASIVKTSTSGLVDTYTVTYSDGTTWAYQVTNGEKGAPGEGVAPGGTTGQMLVKKTDTDYDTDWVDPPEGEVTQAEFDALQTYVEDMSPVVTAGPSAIASVDDAAPLKAEEVEIAIEPVQDLHGYENPWPAGGGKNKLDQSAYTSLEEQTTFSNGKFTSNYAYLSTNTMVRTFLNGSTVKSILSSITVGTRTSLTITVDSTWDSMFIGLHTNGTYNAGAYFAKPSVDDGTYTVSFYVDSAASGDLAFSNVQFEEGSTATAFSPYSNICPISGWTGANVEARGKNLFDKTHVVANERFIASGTAAHYGNYRSEYIPCVPNADYYFKNVHGAAFMTGVFWFDAAKQFISQTSVGAVDPSSGIAHSPNNACYVGINFAPAYIDSVCVNYPATATSYEPFHGSTTPISWADEAGAVYGGTLTWEKDGSVTLTKTMASVDLGTLTWRYESAQSAFYTTQTPDKAIGFQNLICSVYATRSSNTGGNWNLEDKSIGGGNNSEYIYVKDTAYSDAATFKVAMSGVQAVYALKTPVTYTLTPQEALALLRGANNLWADTGDTTLTYRQDVAILLKKLTSQVAALNTAVANT